ncbi:alpha/beta hydrolase [Oculatella sp. LEGE 06141]|uniref:alpha/beta fold hydrolase n=1 Tax=Oculatella sp. LEGE 06141 TaxID=1828648 RepID=UPI00187E01C4|nr:alpha/beta hydrolase [Oculatella sp. LEGE 06141]MBE9181293.1 alpha/beta hydrolase [Oculatella sp. LEGE 06141]
MPEPARQAYFLTPRKRQPEAPLFVFLPGMDGTGRLLRTQTEGLGSVFDVRCLAIPPDDLTDWQELAAQVVNLIAAELQDNPDRSVYLCGESFGGCLAMMVMLRSPRLFSHLILVNPASSFNRRPWILWGTQISRFLPEAVYQTSSVALLPFLASFGRIAAADRQALLEAVQSVSQATSVWRLSMLRQFNIKDDELAQITQPVLVVASRSDRLLPSVAEAEHLVSTFPNAQMQILPNSGHACLLEAGINLYEMMQEAKFLEAASLATEAESVR